MAREEDDREDLMREAMGLPQRAEFRCACHSDLITIGFRTSGAMSIFFGQDPVYQFDPEGRLRRAFVGGLLYRSQTVTLARLRRERTEQQTILWRDDLGPEELHQFHQTMTDLLEQLSAAVQNSGIELLRSIPDPGVVTAIGPSLNLILSQQEDWLSSQIRARRI